MSGAVRPGPARDVGAIGTPMVASIGAGVIVGLLLVVIATSFASLVF